MKWVHGEVHTLLLADGREYPIARWCAECQHDHGYLFRCEHFPAEIAKQIAAQAKDFMSARYTTGKHFSHSGVLALHASFPPDGDPKYLQATRASRSPGDDST
jgi:hypothetical protein